MCCLRSAGACLRSWPSRSVERRGRRRTHQLMDVPAARRTAAGSPRSGSRPGRAPLSFGQIARPSPRPRCAPPARPGKARTSAGVSHVSPVVRETLANAIVGAILAHEGRVHRRLPSPSPLGPMARCRRYPGRTPRRRRRTPCRGRRRPSASRLAGRGPDEDHPAVAEPDVRDLHRRGHAVDQNDLFVGGPSAGPSPYSPHLQSNWWASPGSKLSGT